jgi:hypothetical protein
MTKQALEPVSGCIQLLHVARRYGSNTPGAFNGCSQRVNGPVPVQQTGFPEIEGREQVLTVPAKLALVLSIVDGDNGSDVP